MAGPLTDADYQHLLTGTDDALRAGLRQLREARQPIEVDRARRSLASVARKRERALRKARPPSRAADGHADLVTALEGLREIVDRPGPLEYVCLHSDPSKGVRPLDDAAHRDILLDLLATDRAAERVRAAAARLAAHGWRFGGFLPGPPPAGPWRPVNGTILEHRNRRRKQSDLVVHNSLDRDVVVSLVEKDSPPAIPTLMVYIRAGEGVSTNQIPKRFHVYFKSGTDWDNGTRRFALDRRYQRSVDPIDTSGLRSVEISLGGPFKEPADPGPDLAGQLGEEWADMLRALNQRQRMRGPRGQTLHTHDVEQY